MIKLTNNQIIKLYELLISLDSQTKLPINLGFTIIHNIKTLQSYYQNVMEAREHLIKENGVQTEEGYVQVAPELINKVNQQLYSLLDIEIEIPSLILIDVKQLSDIFKEMSLEEIDILYPISKLES